MAKGWWRPPQLRNPEELSEHEQKASWLELFFDLVFVVAIAELAHYLSNDVSLLGFIGFFALFIPVWWSWGGEMFYGTRFHVDDLVDRLLILLQMAIVAAMAVNIHHGLGDSSVGFALAYAAFEIVLIIQYLMAGYYVPETRSLCLTLATGFSVGALLWIISVFVPIPWRFVLWGLGIIVDLSTPIIGRNLFAQFPVSLSHVPERIGLFTIIVLGESIVAVVGGVAQQEWSVSSVISALFALMIAFTIWWIYFDNLDGSPLGKLKEGQSLFSIAWVYSHLPLAVGIVATGVGVEHLIEAEGVLSTEERWLFCGAVALCLSTLALIHWISCKINHTKKTKILSACRLASVAFILVLAIAGSTLSPVTLAILVSLACVIQVIFDLRFHLTQESVVPHAIQE